MAAKVDLGEVGWGKLYDYSFEDCKLRLENASTLDHPDKRKRMCLYADAPLFFWYDMIKHVPHEDLGLFHAEKRHKRLAYLPRK